MLGLLTPSVTTTKHLTALDRTRPQTSVVGDRWLNATCLPALGSSGLGELAAVGDGWLHGCSRLKAAGLTRSAGQLATIGDSWRTVVGLLGASWGHFRFKGLRRSRCWPRLAILGSAAAAVITGLGLHGRLFQVNTWIARAATAIFMGAPV